MLGCKGCCHLQETPRGMCTEGTAQTPPSSTCLSSGGKELDRFPGKCWNSVPQPAGQEPTCVQLCLVLVYHTQRVPMTPVAQTAPALSHPAWLTPAAIQHHLNSPSESEDKNSESTMCLVPSWHGPIQETAGFGVRHKANAPFTPSLGLFCSPRTVIPGRKGMFPALPCQAAICTSVCLNDAADVLFVLQSLSSLSHEIIRGKTHTALKSLPTKPSPNTAYCPALLLTLLGA